jgi:glucosamine-6-phosphate deaminase
LAGVSSIQCMITTFKKDHLTVRVLEDREQLGAAAAGQVASWLRNILDFQPVANVIFAAAPSQHEFLAALVSDNKIDWGRVNGFHMDEYLGLSAEAPQLFGSYLKRQLFGRVGFREVYYINARAADSLEECQRYSGILQEYPPDLVCMGIGENAHIAFNDPPVANFKDPESVKAVLLDEACRRQQVNDGCFPSLEDVPTEAITLTIPALMRSRFVCCVVPGSRKRSAVAATLASAISERVPSTILRTHANATLFLDNESYSAPL